MRAPPLAGIDLLEAVGALARDAGQPAAVVFNSHITGLAVARSLGRRGIPVIALDRDPKGVALVSRYIAIAGLCPNPLEDEEGFIACLLEIGREFQQPPVLYPANDEWVLAVNRHRATLEEVYALPFAGPEIVEPLLDKARLYQAATRLGVPIPFTWYIHDEPGSVEIVQYPCIVKPVEQRSFYDRFGAKAWRIGSRAELEDAMQRAEGYPLVAQEIIGRGLSDFYSVCSYVGLDGAAHGSFVGRKLEQYPADYGTGCLVAAEGPEELAGQGVALLREFGYRGTSEIEFIYDNRDRQYKLLDVNTRVWKWIGLPIAAGVDLPWLAYADATGRPERAPAPRSGIVWTHARDYLALRLEGGGIETAHYLPEDRWADLLTGVREHVVDAVLDPDDPLPAARQIATLLSPSPYFCAC